MSNELIFMKQALREKLAALLDGKASFASTLPLLVTGVISCLNDAVIIRGLPQV